jgi:hypothetical protein
MAFFHFVPFCVNVLTSVVWVFEFENNLSVFWVFVSFERTFGVVWRINFWIHKISSSKDFLQNIKA